MSRQHDQIYGNQYGPPIGRRGNGLGDVWGGTGDPESTNLMRRPRPNDSFPLLPHSSEDEYHEETDPDLLVFLSESLNQLTARQAFIIGLRYGLRDGVCYRQEEIAVLMGISQQAVNYHEQGALKRLRKLLVNHGNGGRDGAGS